MPEYIAWHPFGNEKFEYIENAFTWALQMIREYKDQPNNNVHITREDIPTIMGRAPIVAIIRGFRLD